LKSQFIKANELQAGDDLPSHIAAMNAWESALSLNESNAGIDGADDAFASPSIADQETVEQRVVYPNPTMQAIMHGPTSPSESGVTPYDALSANGSWPGGPLAVNEPFSQAMQRPPQPGFAQRASFSAQPYAPVAPVAPVDFAPAVQPSLAPIRGPIANMPVMAAAAFATAPAYQQPPAFQPAPDAFPPYTMQPQQPPLPPIPPGGKYRKHRRFPIWAYIMVGFVLFLMLIGGGGYIYYLATFSRPINDITGQTVARLKGDDNPNQGNGGDILSGSRINILLLGSDTDQKFGSSANGSTIYLAQTDIIVSIDPQTKGVTMLSIPRDFYINIPGFGMGKLDEAFEHGYSYGQGGFDGAVALSRLTIYQDFGIPINYYAWVGLDGFVKVINTVGGVDVDVLHPITDDAYPDDVGNNTGDIYAYKRLYIPPGPQHLDGATALEYVRSRHADLVGDFGRSARQQQVLSALKAKLTNSSIISQLPQLAADLDGWVKTDMQLPDVLKLMNFARSINANAVQHVVLEPPYSSSTTLPNGESIVQPNCAAITPELAKLQLGPQTHCDIYGNSNTTQVIPAQQSQVATAPNLSASADVQQLAQSGTTGLSLPDLSGGTSDLFGIRSLLDLLFTVVFESPQAMQI
jgi:LCP family protein required for cell wall assembly